MACELGEGQEAPAGGATHRQMATDTPETASAMEEDMPEHPAPTT